MASTNTTPTIAADVTTVIDAEEFERALVDPTVRRANEQADAFLAQLRREGRDF